MICKDYLFVLQFLLGLLNTKILFFKIIKKLNGNETISLTKLFCLVLTFSSFLVSSYPSLEILVIQEVEN